MFQITNESFFALIFKKQPIKRCQILKKEFTYKIYEYILKKYESIVCNISNHDITYPLLTSHYIEIIKLSK